MKKDVKTEFAVFADTGLIPQDLTCAQTSRCADGQSIDLPQGIGLIERGSVRVVRRDSGVLLNVIAQGGMFGASTLFCGGMSAGTSLIAQGDTKIIFIPQDAFAALLMQNEKLLKNYLAFTARRICFLNGKVGTFATQTVEGRIKAHILQSGGSVTVKSMTQLANTLSIGRASLYRAIEKLITDGELIRDGKTLTLVDIK